MTLSSGSMSWVIIAIISGLVGAYGIRLALFQQPEAAPEAPRAMVVPLASAELPVGREIKLGDIGMHSMTPAQFQARMDELEVEPTSVMLSSTQIVGRILKEPVKQNEPFLTTGLFLEKTRVDVTSMLEKGHRAIRLQVAPLNGGTANPGTIVDVLFRSEARPGEEGMLAIPEATVTLIEAVKVLDTEIPPPRMIGNPNSLDLRLNNRQAVVRQDPPTVTLAVTLEEANVLQTVNGRGEISLIARSPEDTEVSDSPRLKLTLEQLLGVSAPRPKFQTEIYRRTQRNVNTFDEAGGLSEPLVPATTLNGSQTLPAPNRG